MRAEPRGACNCAALSLASQKDLQTLHALNPVSPPPALPLAV